VSAQTLGGDDLVLRKLSCQANHRILFDRNWRHITYLFSSLLDVAGDFRRRTGGRGCSRHAEKTVTDFDGGVDLEDLLHQSAACAARITEEAVYLM